jgi:hypothetical protein
MVTVVTELRVSILDDEGDDASLERGSIQLSQQLGELDVDSVTGLPGGEAPDGARSGSVAALGALLVSLNPSAKLLLSLVQTVRGWLTRGGGSRTVRLEVGGDVLELTGTTSAVQDRLVDEWIRAHAVDVTSQ